MTIWRLGMLAATLAAGAWLAGGDTQPATVEPVYAVFPWGRTPTVSEGDDNGHGPQTPRPRPAVGAPAAHAGAGVLDLCGVGPVSLSAEHMASAAERGIDGLPAPIGRLALDQAHEQMLANLRSQGSSRAAVAALLLQRPHADDAQALRGWAEQVVGLALSRHDVIALAWAEEACGHLPEGPTCRLALIRARTAAEPDNAHHWAALADEDPSAADEAWPRILQARRWHEAPDALLVTTQQAINAHTPAYIKAAIGAQITTLSGTVPTPGEGFLQERCADASPQRQQQCGAVAQLLLDHGDGAHSLVQAQRVAAAAGWTAEQQAPIRSSLERRAQAELAGRGDSQQPLSCAGFEPWQQQIRALASTLAPPR